MTYKGQNINTLTMNQFYEAIANVINKQETGITITSNDHYCLCNNEIMRACVCGT